MSGDEVSCSGREMGTGKSGKLDAGSRPLGPVVTGMVVGFVVVIIVGIDVAANGLERLLYFPDALYLQGLSNFHKNLRGSRSFIFPINR